MMSSSARVIDIDPFGRLTCSKVIVLPCHLEVEDSLTQVSFRAMHLLQEGKASSHLTFLFLHCMHPVRVLTCRGASLERAVVLKEEPATSGAWNRILTGSISSARVSLFAIAIELECLLGENLKSFCRLDSWINYNSP